MSGLTGCKYLLVNPDVYVVFLNGISSTEKVIDA